MNKDFILLIFLLSFVQLQAQDFTMQDGAINTCNGTFYDSGGPDDDYDNNENLVYTICPDDPDLLTVLDFTEFGLPGGSDNMIIYDSDTNDPATEIGTFTGSLTDDLQPISATEDNPSGCLTIEFISDDFYTQPGWSADISCQEPCQDFNLTLGDIDPTCGDDSSQTSVSINETINFEADANPSESDVSDLTFTWNFGGNDIQGQNIQESFNTPGAINATLTVSDANGCSETINFSFEVSGDELMVIDGYGFTLQELVEDVLISGTCANVTNITSPLNAQAAGATFNSYGYFNKSCSTFPFEEGLIIVSSKVAT